MDALKLAFDTFIIGALALPWLALFMRLFFQTAPRGEHDHWLPLFHMLSPKTREAVTTVVIVAVGYLLGSAVARISSDFFDDSEIFFNILPTEDSVRQAIYKHAYCDAPVLDNPKISMRVATLAGDKPAFCTGELLSPPLPRSAGDKLEPREVVAEFFRLQESKMLLTGEDKTGRLRQFHEQIEILRSATLNGGVLFLLFLFGWCAVSRRELSSKSARFWLTYLPTTIVLVVGALLFWLHFHRLDGPLLESHRDPPLAETVLVLLGVGGFLVRRDRTADVFSEMVVSCRASSLLSPTARGGGPTFCTTSRSFTRSRPSVEGGIRKWTGRDDRGRCARTVRNHAMRAAQVKSVSSRDYPKE